MRLSSSNVGPPGLEPGTPWLWVRCSNQLSYGPCTSAITGALAVRCVSPQKTPGEKQHSGTGYTPEFLECNISEITPSKQEIIYFAFRAGFDSGGPEKQLILTSALVHYEPTPINRLAVLNMIISDVIPGATRDTSPNGISFRISKSLPACTVYNVPSSATRYSLSPAMTGEATKL